MLINFTDPMFSNRVLGFENLVDRLERISNESQTGYPPYNICLLYTSPSPRD